MSKTTVGYGYFLGLIYAIGSPIDAFLQFRRNNDIAFKGEITSDNKVKFDAITGEISPAVKSTDKDDAEREITLMSGYHESMHLYHQEQTGSPIQYKGTSMISIPRCFLGDNVTTVPPYSVVVRRNELMGFNGSMVNADSEAMGDANPAEVIAFILNKLIGIPLDQIDITSFTDAAAVLYTEGTGISFAMETRKTFETWLQEILRHIDALLFVHNTTGKLTLKLVRDDYDIGTIPELTDSDISELELVRKGWEDTYTQITFSWTSRKNFKPITHRVTNPAGVFNLGYTKPTTVDFYMFTHTGAVKPAIARTQKRLFYPSAGVHFKVPISKYNPNPGDVFKLNSTKYGLSNFVVRVIGNSGTDESYQTLLVEGLEDIYGIGDADVIDLETPDQVTPIYDLADPVSDYAIINAPGELVDNRGLVVLAAPPATGLADGFRVYIGGEQKQDSDFSAVGILQTDYWESDWKDETNVLTLNNVVGLNASITNTRGAWQRLNTIAVFTTTLGAIIEVVSVKDVTLVSPGVFTISGILRGIAGSTQWHHQVGDKVWILPYPGNSFEVSSIAGIAIEPSVAVTIQAYNAFGVSPKTTASHVYDYNAETPYDVTRLVGVRNGGQVSLSWMPCTRHKGVSNYNPDQYPVGNAEQEGSWLIIVFNASTFSYDTWGETKENVFTLENVPEPSNIQVRSLLNGRLSTGGSSITI